MISLLFSTEGRLDRKRFWLAAIGSGIGLGLLLSLVLTLLWQIMPGEITPEGGFEVNSGTALPYVAVTFAYLLLQIWIGISLGVKRYHDMDKPGTRMLILLIPFVGGLIYFFQAGFGRGTLGTNRYGAAPRTQGVPA
jgi:uncharacterized membrane protein YhaH (DUF805 family)